MLQTFWKTLLSLVVCFFAFSYGALAYAAESNSSNSVMAVQMGDLTDQGTLFTLLALSDCTLILNEVDGLDEDYYNPKLGKVLVQRTMRKGDTYTFRVMMTENIPPMCVTAQVDMRVNLWCPSISGKDGELLLAPGFEKSEQE